ncbi:hypothetical protein QBZ16_003214 [Prototheca wickerhamii]|uniref:Nuclear control of ATPase protein 2 n=1 Tax=Prototheca wickerhamii TaxID=3111 RepID=A0AAD9MHD0_PROWI|nr:hypothetical protein QBZ16_003214 [Prototheca wickerhamii]
MSLQLVTLPLRAVRAPIKVLLLPGESHRTKWHLPVAGLDEEQAQDILFALRRAGSGDEAEQMARDWLQALQLACIAFWRLLAELDDAERNLRFWQRRARRGDDQTAFLWLQRGPGAFARRSVRLLSRGRRRVERWGRGAAGRGVDQAGPAGAAPPSELIEKRVVVFRLVRDELARALAAVQDAASQLLLRDERSEDDAPAEGLVAAAERAIAAAASEIQRALHELRARTGPLGAVVGGASPRFEDEEEDERGGPATGARASALHAALSALLSLPGGERVRRALSSGSLRARRGVEEGGRGEEAATGEGDSSMETALRELQKTLDCDETLSLWRRAHQNLTVPEAFREAARLASSAAAAPLAEVPAWARMPSEFQRRWVRYSLLWTATGLAVAFAYRHSSLAGSGDLRRWWDAAAGATRGAVETHVRAPLRALGDELFATLRSRPSIVSLAEYESDRDSLARMLLDFARERGGVGSAAGVDHASVSSSSSPSRQQQESTTTANDDVAMQHGMDVMMRRYEQELKRPIKNLVAGDLARCLLIQVQKLKVDSESAMLEIDQILKSNELSIALVAAVPAILIAGGLLYALARLAAPRPPDPRTEAAAARLALGEAARRLALLASPEDVARLGRAPLQGQFLYALARAYEEAGDLYARHRGLFGRGAGPEWLALQSEFKGLAAPGSEARKLGDFQRLVRSFTIYQQF